MIGRVCDVRNRGESAELREGSARLHVPRRRHLDLIRILGALQVCALRRTIRDFKADGSRKRMWHGEIPALVVRSALAPVHRSHTWIDCLAWIELLKSLRQSECGRRSVDT